MGRYRPSFIINKVSHQVIGRGQDPTELGRWTWTRLRGRNNMTLQIVVMYCPQEPGGVCSVGAQHQQYLNSKDDDTSPREAFWRDFMVEAREWRTTGNQLIVTLDANEDMRSNRIANICRILHLKEAIISRHGTNVPATQNMGWAPISVILVSISIQITAFCYMGFGDTMPSDHRLV